MAELDYLDLLELAELLDDTEADLDPLTAQFYRDAPSSLNAGAAMMSSFDSRGGVNPLVGGATSIPQSSAESALSAYERIDRTAKAKDLTMIERLLEKAAGAGQPETYMAAGQPVAYRGGGLTIPARTQPAAAAHQQVMLEHAQCGHCHREELRLIHV